MRRALWCVGWLALIITLAPVARAEPIVPNPAVSLPADDSVHLLRCFGPDGTPKTPGQPCNPVDTDPATPYLEWHYWTLHLQAKDGRRFGAQWTFFTLLSPAQAGSPVPPFTPTTVAQVGLTDRRAQTHHHATAVSFLPFLPAQDGFRFWVNRSPIDPTPVALAAGGGGNDRLIGVVDGIVMDVRLRETKRPILHAGQTSTGPTRPGFSTYPFGGYTFYYSRESMVAEGTIYLDGEAVPVRGTAWFDHQWGDLNNLAAGGWDWYAIQLDDGRRIMVYLAHFFDWFPPPFGAGPSDLLIHGEIVGPSGRVSPLAAGDVRVRRLSYWTSTTPWPAWGGGFHQSCDYPFEILLKVRGETLLLRPTVADQEWPWDPDAPFLVPYVESDAVVRGTSRGNANIELATYKRLPIPPLFGFSPRCLGRAYLSGP